MFKSSKTREIVKKMIGNLTPKEALHLVKDKELKNTDLPECVERFLREEGKILIRRLEFYEARVQNRYGFLGSTIEKLAIYPNIWVNWDGLEPFPWREAKKIKCYLDSSLDIPAHQRQHLN